MDYKRAGVASTFSPTFTAVLAEADCFARHCGVELEVLHAAAFDEGKERRFRDALGRDITVRWVENEKPSRAIILAVNEFCHDLLIAGALQSEDADKPFTSGVARELLRHAPCDLLLVPHPVTEPKAPERVVFALDPGADSEFLHRAAEVLRPKHAIIAATVTPFAAAIAASRGQETENPEAWLDREAGILGASGIEVETTVVRSNTGYMFCEVVQGLEADLLIVNARSKKSHTGLPVHLDWLYQVIPTRLLVVR